MKGLLISVGVIAAWFGLLYASDWVWVRRERRRSIKLAKYWAAYHAGQRGEQLNGEFTDSADNDTRRAT